MKEAPPCTDIGVDWAIDKDIREDLRDQAIQSSFFFAPGVDTYSYKQPLGVCAGECKALVAA